MDNSFDDIIPSTPVIESGNRTFNVLKSCYFPDKFMAENRSSNLSGKIFNLGSKAKQKPKVNLKKVLSNSNNLEKEINLTKLSVKRSAESPTGCSPDCKKPDVDKEEKFFPKNFSCKANLFDKFDSNVSSESLFSDGENGSFSLVNPTLTKKMKKFDDSSAFKQDVPTEDDTDLETCNLLSSSTQPFTADPETESKESQESIVCCLNEEPMNEELSENKNTEVNTEKKNEPSSLKDESNLFNDSFDDLLAVDFEKMSPFKIEKPTKPKDSKALK